MSVLKIYNSYTRQAETFEPIHAPLVGLYVCGPTVYGEAHLGHARPYVTFDVLVRYLTYLGYKVRYVRNITDVGHLVGDADEGESKIEKKARLEKLEPMEVVQHYTIKFHEAMAAMNCMVPSIEPTATGHIIEQIEMVQKIIDEGYGYEVDGSVYFDIEKYSKKYPYGKLSGRIVEDLLQTTRDLDGQNEKRNKADFALWKKATPQHIMRWKSPWGDGFPGWHIECSAMSSKYLGDYFDIHGGGMDLMFPHHESEIAQSTICHNHAPAKYWMHCNMITYGGQKMGKSLGNAIDLFQFFKGTHPLLTQAYSPMTIRFFILQTHYRSTLDFSNEALQAAERGYQRLMQVLGIVKKIVYEPNAKALDIKLDAEVKSLALRLFDELNDDLNTAKALATLFELSSTINSIYHSQIPAGALSEETFILMTKNFLLVCEDIFGLLDESAMQSGDKTDALIKVFIDMRRDAKASKDFATSDKIRHALKNIGVQLKDNKDGSSDYIIE